MNTVGIQIVGVLFGLFMFYITFLHQRRNEFTIKEGIFWFGAWCAFLVLAIFPTSMDFFISGVLDFNRRIDFFIIAGFMFLIGITFHIYTIVRKNQKRIEKIVRKVAIDKKYNKK